VPEEQGYNAETVIVGRALQKDFEQRGVHLDSHGQQQALQMSEDIATLGMAISKHDKHDTRGSTSEVEHLQCMTTMQAVFVTFKQNLRAPANVLLSVLAQSLIALSKLHS